MKKFNFYLFAIIAAGVLTFTSCEKEDEKKEKETAVISFESVELDSAGFKNNFPDGLILSDVDFYNDFDDVYSSWEGFAVSKKTDKLTPGYPNQYSVYAASGANGSEKFAVAYSGFNETTNCQFAENQEFQFKSLMINNSTYTFLSIAEGDEYSKKMEAGDWFKIIITGVNATGEKTGKVEYYLADFRNGKSYICRKWTEVNLKSLGKVNKLEFTFESTDNGDYGMRTPAYACIDNIAYYIY